MTYKRLLIVVVFIILSFVKVSFAEEIEIKNEKRNVILILDSSNSINNSDVKNKQEVALKELLYNVIPKRAKTSYISYNHKINNYSDFRVLDSNEKRQLFLDEIKNIRNFGYSDFGLGLKRASEIIYGNEEEPNSYIIFLLSDGEIDLPKNSERTEADSVKDIDSVIEGFKKNSIPIFSIDISSKEDEVNILKKVSKGTRGYYYKNNGEKYNISNEIFKAFEKKLVLNMPETIEKNKTFKLNTYFKDKNNKKIMDDEFYEKLDIKISLISSKNFANLPVKYLNNEIRIDNKIQNSGEYTVNVEIKFDNITFFYDKKTYKVKNNEPKSSLSENITLPKANKEKIYNLDKFFKDKDGDSLSYELITDYKNISLEENNLRIVRDKLKRAEFKIKTVDSEGASIITSAIKIEVVSFYKYYAFYILGFLIVIISAIGFYIYKNFKIEKKKNFNGKINAYFIKLKDFDENIEPLTFYLYEYDRKKVTLKELIDNSGIKIDSNLFNNIYFKPYFDKSILLVNNSKATIMANSKIIKKGENFVFEYKQKIYITLEDNYSELELHFRKI